jgi:hypothetical protein
MYLQGKGISTPTRSGNDLLAVHNQAASIIAVSFIKEPPEGTLRGPND